MTKFERQVCEQIPHLRRYAMALCGDSHRADDLVQDCLERALRKRHLWRSEGRIRSWLFRMLYHLYLNHRNAAPQRREVTHPQAGSSEAVAPPQELHTACVEAMDRLQLLPPDQRAALLLMVLEGPSYKEAARILEIKVGTLRSRLARARETLRQLPEAAPRDADSKEALPMSSYLRRVK